MPTQCSFLGKVRAALLVVGLVLGATASAQQDSGAPQQRKISSLLERQADLEVQKLGLKAKKLDEGFVSWKKLNEDLQQRKIGSLLERKADLEVQKLGLEAKKLNEDSLFWGRWGQAIIASIGSFLSAAFAGFVAYCVAKRNILAAVEAAREKQAADLDQDKRNILVAVEAAREKQAADLDQATHEKRLESYEGDKGLAKHTSAFAIYFPAEPEPIDRYKCAQIGQAISKWYFESGLLLSTEARDAYLRLARALTRASSVDDLCVPKSPDDVKKLTQKSVVEDYRKHFNIEQPNDERVEAWEFGKPRLGGVKWSSSLRRFIIEQPSDEMAAPAGQAQEYEFKDYVFLQTLSSRLRTRLTEDIRSRRLPGQRTPSAGPPAAVPSLPAPAVAPSSSAPPPPQGALV
ncbi:hypothetical protein [Bradyrhizobium sp. AZCC 2230]|uniref:hypothetical protein n=1 Tax=Bradyrhizobium sp. AZCC 2230 TaxID=3117021 RepID=UPI002FEF11C9